MDRKILQILTLLVFGANCAHRHADLRNPAVQDNFGVQMARMNLWREALFRFQRAVEIDPANAMSHNNLAVAWEANGDFDKARKEYLEALKLDRSNQYIQKNYSRFVEFLSRNRKRQQKDVKAAATPTLSNAQGKVTTVVSGPPDTPVAAEPMKPPPPPQPQPPPPGEPR